MITREQQDVLRKIEPLLRQANLMLVQLGLPAVSGSNELGCGLSTALAGLEILLKHRPKK
jgi:hypothetical protein